MKTRLLFTYALMLFSLFLTQNQLTAQQNCDYDYTLRCPPKFQGCLTESTNSANTGFPSIIRSGILCDSVQYSYTDQITLNNDCNNLFDRLWSATIPGSNTTRKCSQKIELFDNTPPQLMSCPPDVTLSLPDSIHTWINPEVSDNCDSVALTSNIASGTSFPLGITQVVFTVTDGCGNTNNCSFTITIEEGCTTEFELICPSDYRGCVGDDIDPSIIGSGNTTHMGDFCGSKSIGHIDSIMTDSICNTFIERTWFATASETDETKTCIQRIELIDSDAPIINNCPPDVTIDNPNTALNWLDPQVNDNCGQVQLISNYNSGAVFSEGQTEVIYSATDECGNESSCSFFVNVIVDTCDQNFTILCPPNFYACLGDSIDPYDTGQANVSHSGDFCGSLNISFQDSVISSFPTKHIVQRLWNATELGDGFTKKCAQIITLEDSQAPTIHNCPKDVTLDSDASSYTWTLPTASDNCTSVTLENSHDNGSTFPEGVTTVTYIASDDNGNSSSCSFDITVKRDDCTDNFEILCPTDYWGCRGESTDPKDTGRPNISHTGNLCGGVGITSEDKIISDSDCSLIIEREWTATLQNGALRKCIQKIRLEDNEAPSIYNCPHDVTLDINNSNYTWDLPTASDNCSTVTIESSHPNGSTFPLGVTKVVYTATDDCGNSSTCSFEITVKSEHTGSDLIIECPDDIILECGQDIHYDSWPLPQVNSSCANCDEDYSSGFVDMGSIDGHRYYCSKFSATWQDAAEHARSMGGYLAVINDEYENNLLSEFLEVRSAFIGLSDHINEGDFKWVDGSSITYSNWYPGQPNDYRGKQDYVELLDDGYWNDQYNYKKLEFIVEIPCIKIEQIGGPHSPSSFNGSSATITYKVTDGCGKSKTCSFDVIKSGSLNLTCPTDLTVNLQSGHGSTHVMWNDPTAETCCSFSSSDYSEIPGFVFMGSRNGHKYFCSKEDLTWKDAQAECEKHGGYLAVIDDDEENTMLANFLTVQSAFIGLSDYNHEGHFKWVNGAPLSYENWYPGQPNNYYDDQHYVEILNNGQWNDQYSYKKREYIMEISGGIELTQISGPANGSSLSAGTYEIKYKGKDACGNIDFCSFSVTVKGSDENDLCHTGPTDSYGDWIESAQFGNQKIVTGNDGGYGDYSQTCLSVTKDKVIEVQLTAGSNSYGNTLYWAIFIDWNKNGKYSKSERIARGRSKVALKGRFIFSNGLPSGDFPMRISANPHGYHDNGCDPITHGEVEDYCLSVKDYDGYITSKAPSKQNETMPEIVMQSFNMLDESLSEFENSTITKNDIEVFPNPFLNRFEIEGAEFDQISIWGLDGKLIKLIKVDPTHHHEIDIQSLSSGAYYIEIRRGNGSFDIKKIVKR